MMKTNTSKTPKIYEKKSVNIGTLIVCFLIACGIWLYAQAIDDDINVKTYNQLPVEFVGGEAFKEATGYDVHSLSVPSANISISGTNRELAKLDPQSIRLVADVSTTNNGVATIKAYMIDDDGNRSELKNFEITPAVVTVYVAKQVQFTVQDITVDLDKVTYRYTLDPTTTAGTFTVFGSEQEMSKISYAICDLDYQSVKDVVAVHKIPVTSVRFYDEQGNLLFGDASKNENVKYDISGLVVSLTVESNIPENNDADK